MRFAMLPVTARAMAVVALCVTLGASSGSLPASFQILGGIEMQVVATAAQTNGTSVTIVTKVPPGGGPPAHVHTREDETYVITRGHFRFWHGTHVIDAPPGTVVYMPRNEPHQFKNVGTTAGETVVTLVPAGLERMFLTMSQRHLTAPKDIPALAKLGAQYGITYVRPLAP